MDIVNTLMAWLAGLGIVVIFIFIGLIILSIVLQVLFLRIGIKAVKGSNREFGKVFVTVLLNALVSLIPCIGCFIAWYVISKRHNTGYGNAILAWLISIIVPWAISIGIALLLSLTGLFVLPF